MCCLLNVSQLVSEATRVTPDTKTLIDYILCSMCDLHLETCVVKTCLSDHYLVKTTLNSVVDHSHKSITCRSFKSFDENQFKYDLESKLNELDYSVTDINELWLSWKNIFISTCDIHAPLTTFRVKDRQHPWVDQEIVQKMRKRDNLHKTADANNDNVLYDKYRKVRNEINYDIKTSRKNYITNMINRNNVKEGNIWEAINLVRGKKLSNAIPKDLSCEKINDCYAEVGEQLASTFPDTPPLWKGPTSIYDFSFNSVMDDEVLTQLSMLENKSKTDVLGIDSKLLFISRFVITASLTKLFNISLINGIVPLEWKKARVTPIFKGKGDKNDCGNYRPLSVISFIAKILEKCIQKQLLFYLEQHDFITVDQSAYLKCHSTLSVLHKVTDNWLQAIDDNLINGVCFF